jgi:hypothetical protein
MNMWPMALFQYRCDFRVFRRLKTSSEALGLSTAVIKRSCSHEEADTMFIFGEESSCKSLPRTRPKTPDCWHADRFSPNRASLTAAVRYFVWVWHPGPTNPEQQQMEAIWTEIFGAFDALRSSWAALAVSATSADISQGHHGLPILVTRGRGRSMDQDSERITHRTSHSPQQTQQCPQDRARSQAVGRSYDIWERSYRHADFAVPRVSLASILRTGTTLQLGDHELASGDWREGEVLFPL